MRELLLQLSYLTRTVQGHWRPCKLLHKRLVIFHNVNGYSERLIGNCIWFIEYLHYSDLEWPSRYSQLAMIPSLNHISQIIL